MPVCDIAAGLIHFTMDAGATAGTVAADNALHRDLVDKQELRAAYASVRGLPGAAGAR